MANPRSAGAGDLTQAVQDYLKVIYHLRTPDGAVQTQDIATTMAVSAASVTKMVKRLAEHGLLTHTPYQGVELTKAGERMALEMIRHHRLLELYLCKLLGVSWDKVHDEAERLEHALSEDLEARITDLLGNPTEDPHGSPIPTRDLKMPASRTRSLADLAAGAAGVIAEVPDHDAALLRYLDGLGVRPGQAFAVAESAPFEGPVTVRIEQSAHALGRALCAHIRVTVTKEAGK